MREDAEHLLAQSDCPQWRRKELEDQCSVDLRAVVYVSALPVVADSCVTEFTRQYYHPVAPKPTQDDIDKHTIHPYHLHELAPSENFGVVVYLGKEELSALQPAGELDGIEGNHLCGKPTCAPESLLSAGVFEGGDGKASTVRRYSIVYRKADRKHTWARLPVAIQVHMLAEAVHEVPRPPTHGAHLSSYNYFRRQAPRAIVSPGEVVPADVVPIMDAAVWTHHRGAIPPPDIAHGSQLFYKPLRLRITQEEEAATGKTLETKRRYTGGAQQVSIGAAFLRQATSSRAQTSKTTIRVSRLERPKTQKGKPRRKRGRAGQRQLDLKSAFARQS